jgi:hypothetical protein
MGSLGENRRDENTFLIESEGIDTTVNGQTIKAFWQNAGIVAVQRFLAENEWAKSVFDVRLPAYAYDSPYSIVNGSEITSSVSGGRCVVRSMPPETNDNTVIQCNVLAVAAPE